MADDRDCDCVELGTWPVYGDTYLVVIDADHVHGS